MTLRSLGWFVGVMSVLWLFMQIGHGLMIR
jgi:hypothetical protein